MAMHLVNTLASSRFFSALNSAQLQPLAAQASFHDYRTGQSVFQAGDASDALYAVIYGRVRISRTSHDGEEITLGLVNQGEIFGEIAVIDGGLRSASACAQEATRLGVIARDSFMGFLHEHPSITVELLRVLCKRQRRTIEQVDALAFQCLEVRLARLLVNLSESYGRRHPEGVLLDLRLGQRELGAFIASSRESVSKQLATWRQDGLVDRADGRLVLKDKDALESLANADAGCL
ncbi:MAG: Crp/Fnr family transcriptional regulator [Geminicoccaceae bacterium]